MFIFAHRQTRGMLDGEYTSVFRGSSLDFDDLRAYVPGDEVRDIDWKATARHGSPLIKRYVAVRKQTVVLVTDTGRNMAATARGGELKKQIALMALGVIGYLAVSHGDNVGAVYGDADTAKAVEAKGSFAHLERVLRAIDAGTSLESGPSNLKTQLEYVARNYRRRMMLFILADEMEFDDDVAKLVRRLHAQHEILWLTVRDAELAGPGALEGESYDVADQHGILGALAHDDALTADYLSAVAQRHATTDDFLRKRGISSGVLGHTDEVMTGLFALLERHRRAH